MGPIAKPLSIFACAAVFGLLAACGSPQVLDAGQKQGNNSDNVYKKTGSFPVAELSRPKFNAAELKITTLTIAKELVDPKLENSASRGNVNVYTSGQADYVELTTVFFGEDGKQTRETENIVTTRHRLKVYSKGKITLLARACVSQDRAEDPAANCGDTHMAIFRSENLNSELVDLEKRIAEKTADLQELSARAIIALAKVASEQKQCELDAEKSQFYTSLFALAKNLLATGDVMVSEFFKPSEMLASYIDPSLMALVPKLEYDKLAASLDSIVTGIDGNYSKQLNSLAGSIPLFKNSADPLKAMINFGGGLFDLFTAHTTEIAECYVPEMEFISTQIEGLKKELEELKKEREALGKTL